MVDLTTATAISPIDGRYYKKVEVLSQYFSDFALVKTRLKVEVEYFISLMNFIKGAGSLSEQSVHTLRSFHDRFSIDNYKEIQDIENVVNHDVKSVELFLKSRIKDLIGEEESELVHFGLTSQDVNDVAIPFLLSSSLSAVIVPKLENLIGIIDGKSEAFRGVAFVARTHGQPASPSTLGKELKVFSERLEGEIAELESIVHYGKFGGATGNLNAHILAYPDLDWVAFGEQFLSSQFGLTRSRYTTQINNCESMSRTFNALARISCILQDLSQDIWLYLLLGLMTLEVKAEEVGSSAMPHKVNPISFENAEGNLQLAISMFDFLSRKLLVSRLQRDLTDYTVKRNIGVPVSHLLLSAENLSSGMLKVQPHLENIAKDNDQNFVVIAEGIQTILRSEGIENSYDLVKTVVRGKKMSGDELKAWIGTLEISDSSKQKLLNLTPDTYIGNAASA